VWNRSVTVPMRLTALNTAGQTFPASLNYIRQQLAQLPQVTLLQRMATDFEWSQKPLMVILNPLCNIFPTLTLVCSGGGTGFSPGGFSSSGMCVASLLQSFPRLGATVSAEPSPVSSCSNEYKWKCSRKRARIDPASSLPSAALSQISNVVIEPMRGRPKMS